MKKKVILVPTTDGIRVGDVVKILTSRWIDFGTIPGTLALSQNIRVTKSSKDAQKLYVYVVDTAATINAKDWCINTKTLLVFQWCNDGTCSNKHLCSTVIATNNPSLPIPQLSQQDLQLVVDKNGKC